MNDVPKVSSFIRVDENETLDQVYYIAHTSLKRFNAKTITTVLVGFLFYIIPGVVLLLYFALRKLKICHGYAAITNKRVIYYEYNEHPEENYQHIRSLHLEDVTGVRLSVDRSLLQRSFGMTVWTEKKALVVGARSFLGMLNIFGSNDILEPGPDALQFLQDISGQIAERCFSSRAAANLS